MLALTRHCLRALGLGIALVLTLALGAAVVRLLPWLLSPHVPLEVAVPFAQALLVVAVEAAFLVGVPVGVALGTATLVERGEARALHCLGISPLGLALRAMPLLLAVAAVALLVGVSWPSNADKPGRFARTLVEQGKLGCRSGTQRSVAVPMVGVTWLCFRTQPARVVGPVPNSANRAWYSAASISLADDLTTFQAEDVVVATGRHESDFKVALRVAKAHVSGLPAWGQSSRFQPRERALLVAALLIVMGLCSVWVTSRLGLVQPVVVMVVPGLAGVLSLRALHQTAHGASGTAVAAEILAVGLGVSLIPLLLVPAWRQTSRLALKKSRSWGR